MVHIIDNIGNLIK